MSNFSQISTNRSPLYRSRKELKKLTSLTGAAVFLALGIAVDLLTTIYFTNVIRFQFSFITKALTGALFGPFVGFASGMLSDVLSYLVYNPTGAAFFPGFTLSSALTGMVYGLFFYKNRVTLWRTIGAQSVITIVVNQGLNTLWLSILTGNAVRVLFFTRLVKNAISFPIEISLIFFVGTAVIRALPKEFRN